MVSHSVISHSNLSTFISWGKKLRNMFYLHKIMCATVLPVLPLLLIKCLICSYNISYGWRIQRERSLAIPLCTIALDCPESWVLSNVPSSSTHLTDFLWSVCVRDWDGIEGLGLMNHFCFDVAICFGSLFCWKTVTTHFQFSGRGHPP